MRKLKKVQNETQTLYDLEYGEKHWKGWKIRNAHCSVLNMAWNLKIIENEKQTLRQRNMSRNTEKRAKWETHIVGPAIWWETLKKVKIREMYTVGLEMWRKNDQKGKWETPIVGPGIWWKAQKDLKNEKCTL